MGVRLRRSGKTIKFKMWSIGSLLLQKKESNKLCLKLNYFPPLHKRTLVSYWDFLVMLIVVFGQERLRYWLSSTSEHFRILITCVSHKILEHFWMMIHLWKPWNRSYWKYVNHVFCRSWYAVCFQAEFNLINYLIYHTDK